MTAAVGPSSQNPESRRADIQALRGLAVFLVLLYHAGAPIFPAGFLGVDVFFVISGYLITGLICRDIKAGTFSFSRFYYNRAKRLLPASLVVITATVLIAPYFITERAFEDLRYQVLGAITFSVNFVLWGQSGYFDTAANTKPLLHFWSLAIEEQYYLLIPLLMVIIPLRRWKHALFAILVLSLALCCFTVSSDPSAAFYAPWNRVWELAVGSLAALMPWHSINARARSWVRLPATVVLVLLPVFPLSPTHPGIDAVLVCLATTALLVGANGGRAENSLVVRLLKKVGNFSYSLYLVHWPLLVFTRAAWVEQPPALAMYGMALASIPIAIALYFLVERPFHKGFRFGRAKFALGTVAASAGVAIVPAVISASPNDAADFSEIRRNNYGLGIACTINNRRPFQGEPPKQCRTTAVPRLLIWGDSYAMAWTSILMGPLREFGIEQATIGACDPLLNMARFPKSPNGVYNRDHARACINTHLQILEYAENNPDLEIVALGGRFNSNLNSSNMLLVREGHGFSEHEEDVDRPAQALATLALRLKDAGKRVVILSPPPADGSQIGDCLERRASGKVTFGPRTSCDLALADVQRTRALTWEMLELASQRADVPVVSMDDFLCDSERCRTSIDGTFIYRDSGHLAYEGAQLIGERTNVADDILRLAR